MRQPHAMGGPASPRRATPLLSQKWRSGRMEYPIEHSAHCTSDWYGMESMHGHFKYIH